MRKAHKLTQKMLAARLQLAGYEFNDLPSCGSNRVHVLCLITKLWTLAEVFNVSCEYLLGLTDSTAR